MKVKSKVKFVCEAEWIEEDITEEEYSEGMKRLQDFEAVKKELEDYLKGYIFGGDVVVSDFQHEIKIIER